MGGLLGRLGVRGGVVVGLVLLVLGIVAIARLAGGDAQPQDFSSEPQPTITVDPTAGDDGVVEVTPTPGPEDDAMVSAAASFTKAWLRRDLSPSQWRSGIVALSTSTLAENLKGVDPVTVPATRSIGEPTVLLRSPTYAQVAVVVDTGKLTLDLAKQGDRWLVDGVDWNRT